MNKILAGLISALMLVSMSGLVMATYVVDTSLKISDGYAIQGIAIDGNYGYEKYNGVAIGNFDVVADCVPPWDLPGSIEEVFLGDMIGDYDYLDYAGDVYGSGAMSTLFVAADDGVYVFEQHVTGRNVAVAQMTGIKCSSQEVLVATDGNMDWGEAVMVDFHTGTGAIQSVQIGQSAEMDAWGTNGQSMLFNNVDAPNFDVYQYSAAPDINWDFTLMYPLP